MTRAQRGLALARLARSLALAPAVAATCAIAHHSLASYDDNRVVEISGILQQVKIANPHSWLWVVVPAAGNDEGMPVGESDQTQWAIETAGMAYVLRSIGGKLHNQFAAGQQVSVSFHPARDGGQTGLLIRLRFADGRMLEGVPVK